MSVNVMRLAACIANVLLLSQPCLGNGGAMLDEDQRPIQRPADLRSTQKGFPAFYEWASASAELGFCAAAFGVFSSTLYGVVGVYNHFYNVYISLVVEELRVFNVIDQVYVIRDVFGYSWQHYNVVPVVGQALVLAGDIRGRTGLCPPSRSRLPRGWRPGRQV